ncbi:MAG TPA: hypothetical protein VGF84_17630, partial [Micromonosporaceae bacterium]
DQLVGTRGATNVYADVPGLYGPLGARTSIPGAGPNGGPGWPDVLVSNAPVNGKTGWWIYEVKTATQASATGTKYGNGTSIRAQIARYIAGLGRQLRVPVRGGDPIVPYMRHNNADDTDVTIFNPTDFNTIGTAFKPPSRRDVNRMQGLVFYSVFRNTKAKKPSPSYKKQQQALTAIQQQSVGRGSPAQAINGALQSAAPAPVTCAASDEALLGLIAAGVLTAAVVTAYLLRNFGVAAEVDLEVDAAEAGYLTEGLNVTAGGDEGLTVLAQAGEDDITSGLAAQVDAVFAEQQAAIFADFGPGAAAEFGVDGTLEFGGEAIVSDEALDFLLLLAFV